MKQPPLLNNVSSAALVTLQHHFELVIPKVRAITSNSAVDQRKGFDSAAVLDEKNFY